MRLLCIIKHTGIILAGIILLLGIPLWISGYIHSLFSDDADAVSGASVIIDSPSGNFVILINERMHPDEEKLRDWVTFFSGGYVLYIFEDISVSVAEGDAGGLELAKSFQSRLPENQMQIMQDDVTLMLSRADHGLFDIIIMSQEFADNYKAATAYNESCTVVSLTEAASENASAQTGI